MRIAMLACGHVVDDSRVTHKQAASQAKAGHQVAVFGLEPMGRSTVPGVELRPVAPHRTDMLSRLRVLPKLLAAAQAWRADVVVCHEPESALVGLLLKVRSGMKFVFDSHECYEDTFSRRMPGLLRPIIRSATVVMQRLLIPRCDWVTVVSPPNLEYLSSMRRDGRVAIIHNSPPKEYFPLCDHEPQGPLTVVHEGFLYRQRGMTQMLEAVARVRRHRDIRFLLVGRIAKEDLPLFGQEVDRLGLRGAVIEPDWLPWEEFGKMESSAQIGLICLQPTPNSFRSLNNKLYNYMCCGQAIIGPEGSATADMLRKYDCGLCVDTSRPEQIAEAIETLAADLPLRKRMGANGRRAIEQELGWHKMEERLAIIYGQLERSLRHDNRLLKGPGVSRRRPDGPRGRAASS